MRHVRASLWRMVKKGSKVERLLGERESQGDFLPDHNDGMIEEGARTMAISDMISVVMVARWWEISERRN